VEIPPQAFENKMKDFVCKCMEGDGPTPHVKNASARARQFSFSLFSGYRVEGRTLAALLAWNRFGMWDDTEVRVDRKHREKGTGSRGRYTPLGTGSLLIQCLQI